MSYCPSVWNFSRRPTREVVIGDPARGGVVIGGNHPVVKQSMLTCDTMDTATCVQQTLDLVAVGCQIVRITAPTVKDAANLEHIVRELRARGCWVPIGSRRCCARSSGRPRASCSTAGCAGSACCRRRAWPAR